MSAIACQPRIEELTTQVGQLDEQRAALRAERDNLDFPALRHDFIREILTNLRGVVDAVPDPQRKHLLQLLLEKVIVQDQRTIEVWYKLPEAPGVRTLGQLVAPGLQCTNHHRITLQGPLTRAVFLFEAGPGPGLGSRPGASVHVVGGNGGTAPGCLFRSPRTRTSSPVVSIR